MRILFLSRWYPYPADNGSRIRILGLIEQLARRHEVHLISFSADSVSCERRQALAPYCASVSVVPYRRFQPGGRKALTGFLSSRPRSAVDTYSREFERQVENIGRRIPIDLVIASEIDMLLYPLKLPTVPRVLEDLELSVLYDRYSQQHHPIKKLRGGLTWWKLTRYLAELLPAYTGCTLASELERDLLLRILPGYRAAITVPNGINPSRYAGDFGRPQTDSLIYAGSPTYPPNLAAVAFFVHEILPAVREKRPRARLLVTGRLDGVDCSALPTADRVDFAGHLDDVRAPMAQSWASVVPLLSGAGTRVKILESLALGTPVVSTSKGAEGLDLVPGRDILLADNPADFAASVVSVLQDSGLRDHLSRNGRQTVVAKYNWENIGRAFCNFIEGTVTSESSPV